MITKFKIFENQKCDALPDYEAEDFTPFITWFYKIYGKIMNEEGWLISFASCIDIRSASNYGLYKNRSGDFWQIQKNDDVELLKDDHEAEKLALKANLLLDEYGIVIGYNGVSFLEYPEELEYYKNIENYNL